MMLIILAVFVFFLFASWITGEAKNIRALRILGAIASLMAVPLAFEFGKVVGHGRAYVAARAATEDFLVAVDAAVERGNASELLKETQRLHRASTESEKRAGSFFFSDMYYASVNLNVVHPPVPNPKGKSESN
jgi:hypothetical protein